MESISFTFAISAIGLGSLGFIFGMAANAQINELKKKTNHLEKEIEGIKNTIGSLNQ